jgi:hypothetical protein
VDYRSRRDLERLLGDLDVDRQDEVSKGRSERIRRASFAYEFEQALPTVLRPALRGVMAKLERRGHAARLQEPRPTLLRVEIELQAARPIHGRIDVELDAKTGEVCFRAERQHRAAGRETLPMSELSESRVSATLVRLLRAVSEEPPPEPRRLP